MLYIREEDGTVAASYKYDAWGRVMSQGGFNSTLASLNPFRYRGYVYDEETGLYYLQSRYYDPQVGRFISADGQINADMQGTNLFAYCCNNSIAYSDPDGHSIILAGIIIGAIVEASIGGHVAAKESKTRTGKVQPEAVALGILGGGILGGIGRRFD